MPRCLLLLPFLLLLSPGALSGQEVKGVAVEAGTGAPIEGAFVSLVDESGERVTAALTSSSGAFVLQVLVPGRYRLRMERIGYETWESEGFEADPGRAVTRRLEVPVRAVRLADLEVAVASRCRPRPGAGEVLRVWEEARKALEVVRWGEGEGGLWFQARRWERELDRTAQRVRKEEVREGQWTGRSAFRALPAGELAAGGFAEREAGGAYTFYGPDARTFLSDAFQETHCFWLVRGEGERAGQLGVAFRPVRRGRAVDVEGVLWVEGETAELRELEYRYTDLDLVGLPRGAQGAGWAEFRNLGSGAWVVRRWWIRIPLLRRHWQRRRVELEVFALREVGGEVTRVGLLGGETLALGEWGTVVGTVEGGLTGGPLEGVEVYLRGTARAARTDAEGRYRLERVPPAEYTLAYRHPELDLVGLTPVEGTPVSVRRNEVARVDLSVEAGDVLSRICPEPAEGRAARRQEPGVLLGFVRSADTAEPVANARVWVARSEFWLRHGGRLVQEEWDRLAVATDSAGAYRVCDVPGETLVVVQAETEGAASDTVWIHTKPAGVHRLDLAVSPSKAVARFGIVGRPVAPVAERRQPRARDDAERERTATLRGLVRSAETGEPVAGATVRLLGTDRGQVTGEDGAFLLRGVPPGRHRVVTEHLGMASDTVEVEVFGAEETVVALFTLETRPVELPGLKVEVERTFRNPRLAGFYGRMEKQRLGSYITSEDLERRDIISNFRRIPGVRVDQCGLPGFRTSNCWTVSFFGRGPLGGVLGPGRSCQEPLIYVDGHLLPSLPAGGLTAGLNAFNVLQQYPRHALEGIEVYRNPVMAPAQYRTLDSACGIVLVWTRDRSSR